MFLELRSEKNGSTIFMGDVGSMQRRDSYKDP